PAKTSTGEIVPRPGIVHRLDRETSGAMLIAKTEESFQNLKKQFQNHEIQKVYEAFVEGEIKNDAGVINRPISRSGKDFRMWTAQRGGRGEEREAVTEYKVINKKGGYSFVEVMPKTGRTHQIRVHFKAINYPLVADILYGRGRENTLGFERLALHSKQVIFRDTNGDEHVVSAPYPKDFEVATALLQSL
ncbi:MAG: 23S rRNA pseudouridine synthase, partial [Parcubacteria bacterium C7867-003]